MRGAEQATVRALGAAVMLFLACAPVVRGQDDAGPVRLEAQVDRQAITIGDPIVLTLLLTYPEGVRITSFTPEAALGPLALLGRGAEAPSTAPTGGHRDTRVLKVTVYELGRFEIPSFTAAWEDASGRSGTATSAPLPFTVASVLPAGDEQPADIKPPAAMRVRPWWPWILTGVAALAAILLYWLRRRRRAASVIPEIPPVPPLPADETAYAELEKLLSSGLLERGEVKAFYIELVEILRRYVHARFGVETFERTTGEILEALREARLPLRATTATAEFFGACDLVKFAKYVPSAEETRLTVERAYRLIDETRPPRESPAASDSGGSGPAAARAAGGAP